MPVTNRAFARFVAETGYRTSAEIAPDPAKPCGTRLIKRQRVIRASLVCHIQEQHFWLN